MASERFHHLIAYGERRVQTCHWLLEDHSHTVAADIRHLLFAIVENAGIIKVEPGDGTNCLLWQKVHQRQRCKRLATTGLTYDA